MQFRKEIQQMQFLAEGFVALSSQFKIILVSINKKAFKFEPAGFFSKLTYGIDNLILKIEVMSYLTSSRKLKCKTIGLVLTQSK